MLFLAMEPSCHFVEKTYSLGNILVSLRITVGSPLANNSIKSNSIQVLKAHIGLKKQKKNWCPVTLFPNYLTTSFRLSNGIKFETSIPLLFHSPHFAPLHTRPSIAAIRYPSIGIYSISVSEGGLYVSCSYLL